MKWISVHDRLPDEDDLVLAFTGRMVVPSQFSRNEFSRYPNHVNGDRAIQYHYENITHWLPMPKPPKK